MKSKLDDVLGLFLIFTFATVFLLVGGIFREPLFPRGINAWAASAYIGIFEMGLAFVLWLKALQLSKTTASISNLVFIAPFLNLILVHFLLGEKIFISTIFGIILIVTGIIIQNATNKKHSPA
ncbi:MAG: EamA family transporter [Bacteroidales bacterium]|jgi:drug/metabolite transporter (DMT)-like permease|nr:EamA family transporter [Bacteroidales bacterium]